MIAELQELELTKAGNATQAVSNPDYCIAKAIELAPKLVSLWRSADYVNKQKLQYLFFPEGITYNRENDECRTVRVNSIFACIAELARVLDEHVEACIRLSAFNC